VDVKPDGVADLGDLLEMVQFLRETLGGGGEA
jgi:hypothetical protein